MTLKDQGHESGLRGTQLRHSIHVSLLFCDDGSEGLLATPGSGDGGGLPLIRPASEFKDPSICAASLARSSMKSSGV